MEIAYADKDKYRSEDYVRRARFSRKAYAVDSNTLL